VDAAPDHRTRIEFVCALKNVVQAASRKDVRSDRTSIHSIKEPVWTRILHELHLRVLRGRNTPQKSAESFNLWFDFFCV
jgi:hypothetical protein